MLRGCLDWFRAWGQLQRAYSGMGNSCLGQRGPAPVTLQIYDAGGTEVVKNVNTFLRAVGTGAFHTGVEVYGKEWSFGFTNDGSSGIFSCPPQRCKTHAYREAVPMGETFLSQTEVESLLLSMAMMWRGRHYDVLRRNCTHFCEEFCSKLSVGPVPAWVGNMALAGRTVDIGMQRVASFRTVNSARTMSTGNDGDMLPPMSVSKCETGCARPSSRTRDRRRGIESPAQSATPPRRRDGTLGFRDFSQDLHFLNSVKSVSSMKSISNMQSVTDLKNSPSFGREHS